MKNASRDIDREFGVEPDPSEKCLRGFFCAINRALGGKISMQTREIGNK